MTQARLAQWALFGATGVTGRLVLEHALARGHRPLLIGRNLAALRDLAASHGLAFAHAHIDARAELTNALVGHRAVLNVAGPFSATTGPLLDAAFAAGTDYLDLNGELAVLQRLLDRDGAAKTAGRVAIGGVGFGVAAADGLAQQVSAALGGAQRLRLSVATDSGFSSPAVAESTAQVIAAGGAEVEDGKLSARAIARYRWTERLDTGTPIAFASAPLAEIAAVHYATSARHIIAGVPMALPQAVVLAAIAPIVPVLLSVPAARRRLLRSSGHAATAPSKASFRSRVWVSGRRGEQTAAAQLEAGEGYVLAAQIAVAAIEAYLRQRPRPGAHTPATAFGADFIGTVSGVRITRSWTPAACADRVQV